MRFRRLYTLYTKTSKTGKKIYYFRIYGDDGKRISRTTNETSKEKARFFVEHLLADKLLFTQAFENCPSLWISTTDSGRQAKNTSKPFNGNRTLFTNPESPAITFEDFSKGWWDWDTCPYVLDRRAAGTPKHPGIKRSYTDNCKLWMNLYLIPYFGKYKLMDITTGAITKFLIRLQEKHNLAAKTINNIRSIFIIMLDEAMKSNLVSFNAARNTIARKVEKKELVLLDNAEYISLFDMSSMNRIWNGNLTYYTFSFIASMTGMRAGELLGLTIDNLHPSHIHVCQGYSAKYGINTTKNSEIRDIPITIELYQLLYVTYTLHPHKSRYIFTVKCDKPMGASNARAAFYKALNNIGITEQERKRRNITFHAWRHVFTTECVKSNMHPEKIRVLTGHKTPEMLSRYTNLNAKQDLRETLSVIQSNKGGILLNK